MVDNDTNRVCILKSVAYFSNHDLDEVKIGCSLSPMSIYTDSILIPDQWAIVDSLIFLSYSAAQKNIIFTMPILGGELQWELKKLSTKQRIDILFEIIVALVVLRQNNIIHNDLHGANILLKQTDLCRLYTIDHQTYSVKSKQQPVIIDFEMAYNPSDQELRLRGTFEPDWDEISHLFSTILTKEDREKIVHADASIILSSMFDGLRNQEIEAGHVIKYFLPMNL